MEELVKKRKIRGGHRGYVSKLLVQIEETADEIPLREIKEQLQEKREVLKRLDEEILEIISRDDEDDGELCSKEIEESGTLQRRITAGLIKIQGLFSLNTDGQKSQRRESVLSVDSLVSSSSGGSRHKARAKLPKLELKKFSGRPIDWPEFWDTFRSAVDDNEELSEVDKFSYLRYYLEESAKKVISGFSLTEVNYRKALELLQRRFAKPAAIKRAHINELMNAEPVFSEKNIGRLRELNDVIETHYRALEAMKVDEETYSEIVVPMLLDKIPEGVRLGMTRNSRANYQEWTMEEMLEALREELELREHQVTSFKGGYGNASTRKEQREADDSRPRTVRRPQPPQPSTASALHTHQNGDKKKKRNCVFCNGSHEEADCEYVKTVEERKNLIFKQGRCLVCLNKGHKAFHCRSKVLCLECKRKHNVAICGSKTTNAIPLVESDRSVSKQQDSDPSLVNSTINATSCISNVEYGGRAVLQTALAFAKGNNCRDVKVRVLFDSGSHKTFITRRVADSLFLQPTREESLGIKTFGCANVDEKIREVVRVELGSTEGKKVGIINAYVVDKISEVANEHLELIKHDYEHLKGIWFSDVSRLEETLEIDILLGTDFLHEFQNGQVIRGKPGEPVALKTKFGWVLSGPLRGKISNSSEQVNVNFVSSLPPDPLHVLDTSLPLDNEVKKMWDLETLGICKENEIHEEFLDNISFTGSRYSVKLPWKMRHAPLPTNYSLALNRLKGQIRRLREQPEILKSYDNIIKEQLDTGIIEQVYELENCDKICYLPHQAVVRKDVETTKVRVVYDASSKEGKYGTSLNDCLHVGPSLTPLLFEILLRFRENNIAIIADIEKAFLNVEVQKEDRDCLRFLWVENVDDKDSPINVYRFNRVVFGVNCSPFLLNAVLRYHISLYKDTDPDLAENLTRSFYVDDLVSGSRDIEGGRNLFRAAKTCMGAGGFNLRKWKSNDSQLSKEFQKGSETMVQNSLSESDITYAKEMLGAQLSERKTKVLGIAWDMEEDSLEFDFCKVVEIATETKVTKRLVLSTIARFFDPLGLICPVILELKVLFQDLCCSKISWDEEIPAEKRLQWEKLITELRNVQKISVPRCLYRKGLGDAKNCYLHGFADASKSAYGAVIYLVYERNDKVYSSLICAKSRVSPLKELSIPRLELMAARILSTLMDKVYKALKPQLKIEGCKYWSDSKTVLCWINNNAPWKQFVQHRINEILQLTCKEDWSHCAGICNPADIASRGVSASVLKASSMWWEGPHWLSLGRGHWPNSLTSFKTQEAESERKKTVNTLIASDDCKGGISALINIERFGSLGKLIRVTTLVLRFIRNLRHSEQDRMCGSLTIAEMRDAENTWVKDRQKRLKTMKEFNSLKLHLGLVEKNDLLICKGRLGNSELELQSMYPVILPRDDTFTKLIVLNCHKRVGHLGVKSTLAELRSRFWVPRGRQYVKKLLSKCLQCIRDQRKPYNRPPEASLPEFRVKDVPPFTNVGIDFAGPLFYKTKSGDMDKCYIALYTCCTSRAIHLDLVTDLTSQTFLRSFRRFTARLGTPSLINTDNAKTFKFSAKFIDTLTRDQPLLTYLQDKGIQWRFNLERAPWWGGYFERLVGTVKRCLRKILGTARLTFDELYTVLVETEGIINGRPMTYLYDEINCEPLTPNHLLFGRKLPTLAENLDPKFNDLDEDTPSHTRRFWYLKQKLDHFRSRWKHEYLVDLREFHRSKTTGEVEVHKGDIVLVMEDRFKKHQWKMGVVQQLIKGKDGIVRGAEVRICSKGKKDVLRRPLQKLVPLERNEKGADDGKVGKSEESVKELENEMSNTERQPKRAAAKDARWKMRLALDSC